MPLIDLQNLPPTGALMSVDPGTRTLGIAVSDGARLVATPVEVIPRGRKLAPALNRLFELVDEYAPVGLVIGLPLNMDGKAGPRAQASRALAHHILQVRDMPLIFQDERLSTAQAERDMIAADLSRANRKGRIDAAAAAIILQTALDRLANQT